MLFIFQISLLLDTTAVKIFVFLQLTTLHLRIFLHQNFIIYFSLQGSYCLYLPSLSLLRSCRLR
jgi:hypothetical protein